MRIAVLCVLAACGGDNVHHLADAPCVQQLADYEVTLTGPTTYACHDPFKAKITLVNNSCAPVAPADVKLAAGVIVGGGGGNCTPSGAFTYPAAPVNAHATGDVLDLTGNPFCCLGGPCPTPFQCDEMYTFTVDTPQGPISKSITVHQSLDGCDQMCP